ncbi:hypothetical protein KY348_02585 [Candidatus Woesearchaeota archaeon]|nr:hypothetical protein [Candidatus Woesearchaeota archaeon]
MKKTHLLLIIASILIISLIISGCKRTKEITNFEECIAAGNPAMESHPRQCRDPSTGRTFTEEIKDSWRLDGIVLMQHDTEGYFGCFGCGLAKDDQPAICIDPVPEMKTVEETENRHCNENFEVVENQEYTGNVGESCTVNEECKTPMEFLVQSNCPFGSACIDSKCKVVCPLFYHDPNPEISKSYPFTCEDDSDCDCSEREQRTIECRCADNKCVSVEAK